MSIYLKKETKKFFYLIFSIGLSFACNDNSSARGEAPMASRQVKQQEKEESQDSVPESEQLIRRYFEEVWNQQELQVIDELTPEPFVLHYQGKSITANHEEHKEVVSYWLNALADYRVELHDIFSDENKVVARYTFTGTHQDSVLEIPPTGKEVRVTGIWICRVENSLLSECWEEYDEQGLINQLQSD